MLIHMILLHIVIKVTSTESNAGTTIFYNRNALSDCWNDGDIVKLRARKAFEEVIPHVNLDEVDTKYVKNVLRYFRKALSLADIETSPHTRTLVKEAMADTIGAHLRSEMLPAVRFAYYAGYVPYRNARQLHGLFDDIKYYLNTQGLGWRKPKRSSQKWFNLTVAKILIGAATYFDPCSCLVTKRDSNSCIHLPIPKHDDDRHPAAVALPFKSGGLFNLVAPSSNNVLLKYYTTASRCILSSSPEKCRHSDFISFNNELWHWMKRDVAPHLVDEELYAAYGGILRIAAAVQNYGKGLSRRNNIFEYQDAGLAKWNPWKSLSQSRIYINADWTPTIYVALILLTAFSIYLVQICYTFICGSGGCQCRGPSLSFFSKEHAAHTVNPIITPVLPRQSAIYYSDKKRTMRSTSKTKSASLGSIRTQKVYDLNENTEKLMAVIMSGNEESVEESLPSRSSDENALDMGCMKRPKSPPKLQTSMSQVTVNRLAHAGPRLPIYSTSTMTRTQTGQNASDSVWSVTETSTSSRSGSSTSSKSRRSRSSRDLAWARKVISKNSLRSATKSSSRTEVDLNAYKLRPRIDKICR